MVCPYMDRMRLTLRRHSCFCFSFWTWEVSECNDAKVDIVVVKERSADVTFDFNGWLLVEIVS